MSDGRKPKLLLTVHRQAWVDQDLLAGLAKRFDVHVRAVRGAERPSKSARRTSKTRLIVDELLFAVRLIASPSLYRSTWGFACLGGQYATLLLARLLRIGGQRKRTYLFNLYLHGLSRNPVVKRVLAFLLTDDVMLVAQSTADAEYFRQFLDDEHIVRVPYCQGPSRFVPFSEAELGGYVFSGGWTNRDYDALLRCAARLPQVEFVIVASVHTAITESAPPNVSLLRDRDSSEFDRLLAKSRIVVIPLRDDVGSSGQMVLLHAMHFGKATVVPRVGAVADYIDEGRTGLFYELGDDDSLVAAIRGLLDDERRSADIGRSAREAYLARFTPTRFNRDVVDFMARQSAS
jgi:glycosyltransferase involved in cell wall biosynthesis